MLMMSENKKTQSLIRTNLKHSHYFCTYNSKKISLTNKAHKNVSFYLDLIEATWLNILLQTHFRTLQFKKNYLFPWLWLLKENHEHFERRVEYPVSWSASRVIWCVFGFPPLSLYVLGGGQSWPDSPVVQTHLIGAHFTQALIKTLHTYAIFWSLTKPKTYLT